MSRFARSHAWLLALSVLLAWPLHAAEPKAAEPSAAAANTAELAGHYYLDGVMETGSELLLRPDGRFQWYFTYGALDLAAEGRWRRDGERVVLDADKFQGPQEFPQTTLDDLRLRIDGEDLVPAWPWEDGAERGRYSRE